ncbi:hypothetical protein TIFTF001_037907 [Ficus carica]|uniref:Wall-associated receptor kinase domain-containing protein n=1 Tax=Ficus carica TaxID=3494 RepID=A0AA88JE23_FICCA|nr:hypothetical protein TIFTF001_037907 [Ficus carica]
MPFDFSSRNTFVAVSCGVLSKIDSRSDNIYSQTGNTSICSSSSNSTASNSIFCDGVDCCQTSIDIYKAFEILFDNSTVTAAEQDQNERENQCKFAFMVDGDYWYRHENSSTTFTRIRNSDYVPVNLSWGGANHSPGGLEAQCVRPLDANAGPTMEAGSLFEIVDSQVLEDAPKKEIRTVANIAQRCLNFTGRNRPTMREVAMELDKIQKPDRASSTVQSNHDEEVEYVRTLDIGTWDAVSTSTASTFKKTDNVDASKLLEISLLSFESH